MTKDEAMKLALEALEWSWGGEPMGTKEIEAMSALRQALDQPEQSLASTEGAIMTLDQERAMLPCPFCGGEPRISKQIGESLWSHDIVLWTGVQCDECEAQVGPTCEGFEFEAVDIWNNRSALQSQDREDAERYRLLRRGQKWSVIDGIGNDLRAEELDTAIDHARRVEEKK